jgi:hypothetical protein
MVAASITSRTRLAAAKRRQAASSVAPVASGYERSLRPCLACFSPRAAHDLFEGAQV